MDHISLARWADIFITYPATANVIGKFATGIADDLLSTSFLSMGGRKAVAPAMNPVMYSNEAVIDNIAKLKERGIDIIGPADGIVACGEIGQGRLVEPEMIFKYIAMFFNAVHPSTGIREREYSSLKKKDGAGRRFIVTAGPTREYIDSVRFITNRSTGRMGLALVRVLLIKGHNVVLVTGAIEKTLLEGVLPENFNRDGIKELRIDGNGMAVETLSKEVSSEIYGSLSVIRSI